jgi:quaternary ammonium compound-resistance protein SugE
MAWILLFVAGLFEVAWAVGLKASDGFSRFWPTVATVLCLAISMLLLGLATERLPIGTAYAVWVGIGALGAAVLGMVHFDEPRTAGRLFFHALLLVAIVGLKLTHRQAAAETAPGGAASER